MKLVIEIIQRAGLGDLSANQQEILAEAVQQELASIIGRRAGENMNEGDMIYFKNLKSAQEQLTWLDAHCPNHREIVGDAAREITARLATIKQSGV